MAQHALLVESITRARMPAWPRRWLLATLLHDAPEYVIGDLISPFKQAIGFDYKAFEMRLLEAIHLRFGLPATLPAEIAAEIKAADRIAAYYEATRLAGFQPDEAERYFGSPECGEHGRGKRARRAGRAMARRRRAGGVSGAVRKVGKGVRERRGTSDGHSSRT